MLRIATNAALGTTLAVLTGCQSMVAPVDVLGVCDPAGQPHVSAMVTRFQPCQVGRPLVNGIAVCPPCASAGTTAGCSACDANALSANSLTAGNTTPPAAATPAAIGQSSGRPIVTPFDVGHSSGRPIVTPFDVRPEPAIDAAASTDAGLVLTPVPETDTAVAPSGPLVRVQRPAANDPPVAVAPPKPKPVFRAPVTQWSREAKQKRPKPPPKADPSPVVEHPSLGPLPQQPIPYPRTGL